MPLLSEIFYFFLKQISEPHCCSGSLWVTCPFIIKNIGAGLFWVEATCYTAHTNICTPNSLRQIHYLLLFVWSLGKAAMSRGTATDRVARKSQIQAQHSKAPLQNVYVWITSLLYVDYPTYTMTVRQQAQFQLLPIYVMWLSLWLTLFFC